MSEPAEPTAEDPIERERRAARDEAETASSNSAHPVAPGAGEAGAGTVSAPVVDADGDVPAHPNFGEPARHDEGRPDYRSGQLDEGDQSGQSGA